MTTYLEMIGAQGPIRWRFPFKHNNERLFVNIGQDDTAFALGMESNTLILVEGVLRPKRDTMLEVWSLKKRHEQREQWLRRSDELERDVDFSVADCNNVRRGGL